MRQIPREPIIFSDNTIFCHRGNEDKFHGKGGKSGKEKSEKGVITVILVPSSRAGEKLIPRNDTGSISDKQISREKRDTGIQVKLLSVAY